jgi:hypothetical protein
VNIKNTRGNIPLIACLIGCMFIFGADRVFHLEREWIPLGFGFALGIGAVVAGFFTKRAASDSELRIRTVVHTTLMIAPWVIGCLVVVNGATDSSGRVYENTVVVKVFPRTYGRSGHGPEVDVASWLPSGGVLTVSVSDSCFKRLARGDSVKIVERNGELGMRWIEGVLECGK